MIDILRDGKELAMAMSKWMLVAMPDKLSVKDKLIGLFGFTAAFITRVPGGDIGYNDLRKESK